MTFPVKIYTFAFTALFAGMFSLCFVFADEHPSEHPTEKQKETKTEEKKPTVDEFRKAAYDHIKKIAGENKGIYPVHDDKEKKDRKLKFDKMHEKKLTHVEENVYFACMDFMEGQGKKANKIDMDFFMEFSDDGWALQKVMIHKVNGKLRLKYVNNKPVPVDESGK